MKTLADIERVAFYALAASTALAAIGRLIAPEYYLFPDSVLVALLVLVVLGSGKMLLVGAVSSKTNKEEAG